MPHIDMDREVASVREKGQSIREQSWFAGTCDPSQVAVFVAATEHVEALSTPEVVEIVRAGLNVELASERLDHVRDLARDVLVKRAAVQPG